MMSLYCIGVGRKSRPAEPAATVLAPVPDEASLKAISLGSLIAKARTADRTVSVLAGEVR